MSDKKHESKKSLAIFALPICMVLGISLGMVFGSLSGNIPMGICFGIMGGAAVGIISFGLLYSILNKKDK